MVTCDWCGGIGAKLVLCQGVAAVTWREVPSMGPSRASLNEEHRDADAARNAAFCGWTVYVRLRSKYCWTSCWHRVLKQDLNNHTGFCWVIQKKTAFPRELLGVVGLLDLARHALGMCASVCVCVFVCVCVSMCAPWTWSPCTTSCCMHSDMKRYNNQLQWAVYPAVLLCSFKVVSIYYACTCHDLLGFRSPLERQEMKGIMWRINWGGGLNRVCVWTSMSLEPCRGIKWSASDNFSLSSSLSFFILLILLNKWVVYFCEAAPSSCKHSVGLSFYSVTISFGKSCK